MDTSPMGDNTEIRVGGYETYTCYRQLTALCQDLVCEQGIDNTNVIVALGMVLQDSRAYLYSKQLVKLGKAIQAMGHRLQNSVTADSIVDKIVQAIGGSPPPPPGMGGLKN